MAFHEIGLLLYHSLTSLGYPCRYQINQFDTDAVNILLGYQILNDASSIPPCEFIIYQLEQLSDHEGWFKAEYLSIFGRAREIWDYATENIRFLAAKGIEHVRHLPIGFHEKLQTIAVQSPVYDVLFYGCLNQRREAVLRDLARDCNVKVLFGLYGPERDRYIAQSKVVLNIHFYEAQIMEQPRITYLLNNARFILSETSRVNPFGDGLCAVPYDQLTEQCRYWLQHPDEREQTARCQFDLFRQAPMTGYLQDLLKSSSRMNRLVENIPSPESRKNMGLHTLSPLSIEKRESYFRLERKDVIEVICRQSLQAKRVLELGCSNGATGKALKGLLGAEYYEGLDMSPEAAEVARQSLDLVHVVDIEKLIPQSIGLKYDDFDLLLGLDVLEHLYDPWETLAKFVACVRPGGHVVLSIPNVGNIAILDDLANGLWKYTDAGLLDATHIRFFTLTSIQALVRGAGLELIDQSVVSIPNPDMNTILDAGNSIRHGKLQLHDLTREDVIKLCTYQYIITAKKPL